MYCTVIGIVLASVGVALVLVGMFHQEPRR